MLPPLTSFKLYRWRERERERERERVRLLSTYFVAFDETEPEYEKVLGGGTQML